ncbi:proline-rich protein 3 isoform X2 [Mus pahari]|uniref:proline-rich protein 3 isoform X2 n=1 Tax=Mus pahari TaxID=10093 RepID=UPI001114F619|nr:proline-rich protein 3 isoform X2 [Mus pahari]
MRQASRVPPEARSLSGVSLSCGEAFPRGEELHKGEPSFPTRGGVSEAPCRSERPRHIHDLPEVAWWAPRSPGPSLTRKRKESWCASSSLPSKSAAAIAAAAMPKRKKQDQQPPPPQQLLALSERDEPGDGEDERPTGQPSVNYSPEGRRGEKNYDGPTVKDHPAFWALPPWLTGSLVIPSQTSLTALSADTFLRRATVDMKTIVPSTIQASTDLLCETVPSHPGWKEPSDLVAMHSVAPS